MLRFASQTPIAGSSPRLSASLAHQKELIEQGIDPVKHKKDRKLSELKAIEQTAKEQGKTFEQVARRLHEAKSKKTTDEYRDRFLRQLEIHVFPVIGHKAITEIQGGELLSLFRSIAAKTNHGRPMTYMAKRLCQWTGEVFDLAHIEDNNFSNNPCRLVLKHLPSHDGQHMAHIHFNELSKFIEALQQYNGHALTKAAIWMLLYTGMRQASVRRALWQDFNLEKAIWNRQPEKLDKSIHILPLPKQAVTLLNEIKSLTGGTAKDLVFPSIRNPHHPMSEAAVCQALDRMGLRMVGHGLRGLVSTGLNELGFPPHIVEAQLGHKKQSQVEAAYNKATYLDERRKMMQKWADHLSDLIKHSKHAKT